MANVICLDLNGTLVCSKRMSLAHKILGLDVSNPLVAKMFAEEVQKLYSDDKDSINAFSLTCHRQNLFMFKEKDTYYAVAQRPYLRQFLDSCRGIADKLYCMSMDSDFAITSILNGLGIAGYFDGMFSSDTDWYTSKMPKNRDDRVILVDDKVRPTTKLDFIDTKHSIPVMSYECKLDDAALIQVAADLKVHFTGYQTPLAA